MYGISAFDSIINAPEAAILSVGAAQPRALVDDARRRHLAARSRRSRSRAITARSTVPTVPPFWRACGRSSNPRRSSFCEHDQRSDRGRVPRRRPRRAGRGARARRERDPLRRGHRRRRRRLRDDARPGREVRRRARLRHPDLRARPGRRRLRQRRVRQAARDRDHVRRLPAARDGRHHQPGDEVLVPLERAGQRARSSCSRSSAPAAASAPSTRRRRSAGSTRCPGSRSPARPTPSDAKSLLKQAIRDDNPVLFLEHKRLLGLKGEIDADAAAVRPGAHRARRLRPHDRVGHEGRARLARRGRGSSRGDGHRLRGHRPAHDQAARHRDRHRVGRAHDAACSSSRKAR